jgi:hypothetical protein
MLVKVLEEIAILDKALGEPDAILLAEDFERFSPL